MIKAVIFDLDGVIIDSEGTWFQAGKELCAEYGHDYDMELYRKVMGGNGAKAIKEGLNLDDSAEIVKNKFMEKFLFLLKRNGIKKMGGIDALLEKAKKDFVLALASSAPIRSIDFIIDELKIRGYFSVVMSGEHVKNSKPEPDIFLVTAEKLGIKPDECMVIEDSPNGIRAAKDAGMKCIALKHPYVAEDDIRVAKADIIVERLDEIKEKLLEELAA